ncbi:MULTISPECIES: flagellar motor protein MotD [Marinobacter]|jgi:chemotaxis protein MotB|uniref:Flagellar motor rotation protein MotB n=1 Tax=Marinobacter excellens LAMA 842 TaxID=1306954 RepID=A0A137SCR7_9GAMM|nr:MULTISPECIES: flagellar motor protein MotD [Marinobacter]KXO10241.1 Flagellar motor rotation protein MotB [Marinobacter excellens LAMA 842]MCD1630516.1 flagellar motor protein MotD [Marinobacter shengliensis]
MRRRRQPQDDLHNKERWLISYADFITLLFAFFVVMYSVSSVNEGKYKVLSETLTGVFNAPQRSVQPVQVGDQPVRVPTSSPEDVIPPPVAEAPRNPQLDAESRTQALRTMADQLTMEFDELINQGVVSLETNEQWLELNLPNSMLFSSGDAEPHYDAFQVIEKIATVLRNRDNAIKVEGFTDNQPIRTSRFPSNWELSSARASAVARMLMMEGVEPERLAAVGYGQYQPVARNDTEEGRRRNRRVVLLISRDASIRGAVR